jgi:iron complex outermembrane receptor protein
MTVLSNRFVRSRTQLLASAIMIANFTFAGHAVAQAAPQQAAQDAAADDTKLEQIVVTAQKREQNLQDVPIAVTALSQNALQANRVTNVNDLSGLAPGVQVRAAAGGSQLASFTIRGAVSYGVVPGSDKEVSIYLDGGIAESGRKRTLSL